MSWTRISKECFQHHMESMPWVTDAVLRANGVPMHYQYSVPNKVLNESIFTQYNWIASFIDIFTYNLMHYFWPQNYFKCEELLQLLFFSKKKSILWPHKIIFHKILQYCRGTGIPIKVANKCMHLYNQSGLYLLFIFVIIVAATGEFVSQSQTRTAPVHC